MAATIPRNYFLFVHDCLRKVVGRENVELSAFVKDRQPFQCDMLVNASQTDPDWLDAHPQEHAALMSKLQETLGQCTVRANPYRADIIFRDEHVIRLAFGAPKQWLNHLSEPKDINDEPNWRLRRRLRLSLGYDEDLFVGSLLPSVNLAARALEKRIHTFYKRAPVLSLIPGDLDEVFAKDYRDVVPPVLYWQAHCYALSLAYPVKNIEELEGTVAKNFALYYQKYPFDNPFCAGEDLNTMSVVQLLCSLWNPLPISDERAHREIILETRRADAGGSHRTAGGSTP